MAYSRLALAIVLVLLAGCAGPSEPRMPDGEAGQWDSEADLWLVRTTGCGFCGPATGQPVHELLAYDQAGGVLFARYARAESGTDTSVANASLEPYLPTLSRMFDAVAAYAVEDGQGVVVHEVATGKLASNDEAAVDRYLETALRSAMPPGPPDFDNCADCAAVTLDALSGNRQLSVVLNLAQGHENDAWRRIDNQLLALRQWVQGDGQDPRAGTGGPPPAETPEQALAGAWVVRSAACSVCSEQPAASEFHLTLTQRGGSIVAVDYSSADQFSVGDDVGVEPDALRDLFAVVDAFGEEDEKVRVDRVRFATMPAAEFDAVRGDLEAALGEVSDLGPPNDADCVDCRATHVDVLGQPEWHVQLQGNTAKGDAWLAVDRSMAALDDWIVRQS